MAKVVIRNLVLQISNMYSVFPMVSFSKTTPTFLRNHDGDDMVKERRACINEQRLMVQIEIRNEQVLDSSINKR